ncbi:hypothetical protein [Streptomyces osmaniensis]|uniref:Uncharacterized protein n=1 Tax=Streptomyces osmaniensis TaxID=593134 RepID=A0ABP6Z0K7_9ACTN|nr:hypothetical protein KJK32_45385 [Streptomyces sp. JCM17656]
MAKQHSSFNRRAKAKAAPPLPAAQRAEEQRRLADGLHRPAPSLAPPSREDAWVQERIAAQEAREAADREARQGAPDENTE